MINVDFRCLRPYFATGDLKEAVHEYAELQKRDPNAAELKEAWLLKAAKILEDGGADARAFNVYGVCYMMHNTSSRALAGVAGIYARIGKTESARNFYSDALKKLPDDKSLDAAQRQQLEAAWESAQKGLEAKQGQQPAQP